MTWLDLEIIKLLVYLYTSAWYHKSMKPGFVKPVWAKKKDDNHNKNKTNKTHNSKIKNNFFNKIRPAY